MAHSFRSVYFHTVWSTKKRKRSITTEIQERLYQYIGGIIRNYRGQVIQIGGTNDHIHILYSLELPDIFSQIIRSVKSNSTIWVHKNFPHLADFAWQEGYGTFSVSYSSLESVIHYIKNQEEHHKKITFEDEFKLLLKTHQIAYDERFVVD